MISNKRQEKVLICNSYNIIYKPLNLRDKIYDSVSNYKSLLTTNIKKYDDTFFPFSTKIAIVKAMQNIQ